VPWQVWVRRSHPLSSREPLGAGLPLFCSLFDRASSCRLAGTPCSSGTGGLFLCRAHCSAFCGLLCGPLYLFLRRDPSLLGRRCFRLRLDLPGRLFFHSGFRTRFRALSSSLCRCRLFRGDPSRLPRWGL